MARSADPMSHAAVVAFTYSAGIPTGVLSPDDGAMYEIEHAVAIAERSSDDVALAVARMTLGIALVHRSADAERNRGQQVLAEVSEAFQRRHYFQAEVPSLQVYLALRRARSGDLDGAIPLMRGAVDHLFREGRLLGWCPPLTNVLVPTLLDRGTTDDVAEAEAAIERLATAAADDGMVLREVVLLRLRALTARARGDERTYVELRDRYRHRAELLGYAGHVAWASEMP